jgi:hypothetical protein
VEEASDSTSRFDHLRSPKGSWSWSWELGLNVLGLAVTSLGISGQPGGWAQAEGWVGGFKCCQSTGPYCPYPASGGVNGQHLKWWCQQFLLHCTDSRATTTIMENGRETKAPIRCTGGTDDAREH